MITEPRPSKCLMKTPQAASPLNSHEDKTGEKGNRLARFCYYSQYVMVYNHTFLEHLLVFACHEHFDSCWVLGQWGRRGTAIGMWKICVWMPGCSRSTVGAQLQRADLDWHGKGGCMLEGVRETSHPGDCLIGNFERENLICSFLLLG